MVFPLSSLPGPLDAVAKALPAGALSEVLHACLGRGGPAPAEAWIVLAIWAVAAPAAAARLWRWE
jgi:ABC-2 type transport system permease protein